ncbi:hypothetical protein BDF14DRAFT_1858557 [Spinellus fusiger]|nr:hypothetical protein BDF14DRAFT_1858557 [Spinellus fusiger]
MNHSSRETRAMDSRYNSCMDEDTINSLGPTPIYKELAEIYRLFPVEEPIVFPQHTQIVTQALVFMLQQGIEPLQSLYVGPDDKNPNVTAINVLQPDLGLPSKEYYDKKDILLLYKTGLFPVMKRVLEPSRLNLDEAGKANLTLLTDIGIDTLVTHAIAVEAKIAKAMLLSQDLLDPTTTYHPMTLDQLQENYPFLHWTQFLRAFIPKEITEDPPFLIVNAPLYQQRLVALLKTLTTYQLRDYFVVRHVLDKVYALDTTTRSLLQQMKGDLYSGTHQLLPRHQTCTKSTSSTFGPLAGRYFVLATLGGESERHSLEQFVTLLQSSWIQRLLDIDWLDTPTRHQAVEKMERIQSKLAYTVASPDMRSDKSLEEYTANLTVTSSYYENQKSVTAWELEKIWRQINQPVDKRKWMMNAQDVNAYYTRTGNEVVVPAGILRSPFYDPQVPASLNYGGIGMVIGHELSHALDNAGRMYNQEGRLEQWWTNDTLQSYEKASQCYVDQYNHWTVEGENKTLYGLPTPFTRRFSSELIG